MAGAYLAESQLRWSERNRKGRDGCVHLHTLARVLSRNRTRRNGSQDASCRITPRERRKVGNRDARGWWRRERNVRTVVARFVFGPSFDLFHADESGVALTFSVSVSPASLCISSMGSRLLLWAGRFLSVPPRVYSGIETLLVRSTRPCIPLAPVTRSGSRSTRSSFSRLVVPPRLNWNAKCKRRAPPVRRGSGSVGGSPTCLRFAINIGQDDRIRCFDR